MEAVGAVGREESAAATMITPTTSTSPKMASATLVIRCPGAVAFTVRFYPTPMRVRLYYLKACR